MRPGSMIVALAVLLVVIPNGLGQEPASSLPKVVQHAEPVYPPLARQAAVEGEVVVRFTTDGESVTETVVERGNPVLRDAAENNVKTWKFAPHTPGTFYVTFRYKLVGSAAAVEFLDSSNTVDVLFSPPPMIIDYSGIGLGTWRTRIESDQQSFRRTFELSYTGAEGEWLDATTKDGKGEDEESDSGLRDGDFLAFTITLRKPNGRQVKMIFAGKKAGNRIAGTFVDGAGRSGKWTAVRVADRGDS